MIPITFNEHLQINSIKVDNQVFNCWPGESVMWYVNKYIVYLCSNNLDVLQVKTEPIYYKTQG